MNKTYQYILLILLMVAAIGCNPEAAWVDTYNVNVKMNIDLVSSGFAECSFTTDQEAYYLISIEETLDAVDPFTQPKQFMMLAIDSANLKYLAWRNELLKAGEFNIAPFASHALQYGPTKHFFTSLIPDTDYWVFAFAVNPVTLEPISKLNLVKIHTTKESVIDAHVEYRVKGYWDYIYPVDSTGAILSNFPYMATTRDSAELEGDPDMAPFDFFVYWTMEMIETPNIKPYYGVQAMVNDGVNTHLKFEEGHTYYTFISGFDGYFIQSAIFRFRWLGEDSDFYFTEEDDANIFNLSDIPE